MRRRAAINAVLMPMLAAAIIAASFGYYRQHTNLLVDPQAWSVFMEDQAEYRFTGEHFWGVEHDYSTYIGGDTPGWWTNLSRMPWRGIGVGSYYQIVRHAYQTLHHTDAVLPDELAGLYRGSQQLLLMLAYLVFFLCCRRVHGTPLAFTCLAVLISQWQLWRITEDVMSEPLVRMLFVLVASIIVLHNAADKRHWMYGVLGALGLLLLAATMKSHTLIAIGVLGAAFLIRLVWDRRLNVSRSMIVVAACLLAPIVLYLINVIGWGYQGISGGTAVYVDLKTEGAFMQELCADPQRRALVHPGYCDRSGEGAHLWRMFVPAAATTRDFVTIDRMASAYIFSRPSYVLGELASGVWQATNFPADTQLHAATPSAHQTTLVLILDMLTWVLLLAGLFFRRTVLLSMTGIGLWMIPLVSNIAAICCIPRFHRSMAALPLMFAILVAAMLLQPWWARNNKRMQQNLRRRFLSWSRALRTRFR